MNWKKFFFYFRYYFLLIAILAVVLIVVGRKEEKVYVRTNQGCLTTERVFDYADVLNDEEEEKLRALIAEKELETGCDIVLVTWNESLEEYAKSYEEQLGHIDPSRYVMVFADNFYDEKNFGFDKVHGDGVILLDNWYREADGRVYSWLSTCGRAEDRFSSGMIDSLLDDALEYVDDDPYGAYREYVELFAKMMNGKRGIHIPAWAALLLSAIITAVYLFTHLAENKGEKTVSERTYLARENEMRMKRKEDIFLRKSVSTRKIETNNGGGGGGGGGGHHVSSGGVSHGGGGHSR